MEQDLETNQNPEIITPVIETPQVQTNEITPEPTPEQIDNPIFGKYFQTAQVLLFGIMTASFIYSIYYYKKKLDNDAIILLQKETEQLKFNLKKLMGSDYEN